MTLDLNTNIDNQCAGFRLVSLEVFNWGTFHDRIWRITPNGKNGLLTGDIGSGKSTLVDAVTTLLVPGRKIVYNKAAGAETRERSLKTYVLGAYKNEKVSGTAKAKDVYLRAGGKHYSVIIANFHNEGTGNDYTLAQVLYEGANNISRMYLTAERPLTVTGNFADFSGDINRLRRRLRSDQRIQDHKSFTAYMNNFMRRFGIKRPEALDLFYQTVSMKQVGNLTEFVRERMLGRTDIGDAIEALIKSFDDARAAHAAVLLARRQLDQLEPMMVADKDRQKRTATLEALDAARREIPSYFAYRNLIESRKELDGLGAKWSANRSRLTATEKQLTDQQHALDNLRAKLSGNDVYQRLNALRGDIQRSETELAARQRRAQTYYETVQQLNQLGEENFTIPSDAAAFSERRNDFQSTLEHTEVTRETLQEEKQSAYIELNKLYEDRRETEAELQSLRERPTSIPRSNLSLRHKLLQDLDVPAAELPFAGELLTVREAARDWEGAIERVLRGLGLSLLVPERHYQAVNEVANRLYLDGRLVYLRTLPHRGRDVENLVANSLVDKVTIKRDSEHYEWLERELRTRYDYECCETLADFQQSPRGLTKKGLVKSGRFRHDKDDRHRVDDRRRYILGWMNEEKILALEKELQSIERKVAPREKKQHDLQRNIDDQLRRRELLQALIRSYEEYSEIDFAESSLRLQQLRRQEEDLRSQDSEVNALRTRIESLEKEHAATRTEIDGLIQASGGILQEVVRLTQRNDALLQQLSVPPPGVVINRTDPNIEQVVQAYRSVAVEQQEPSPALSKLLRRIDETHPRAEADLIELLTGPDGRIARERAKLGTAERRIIRQMSDFRNAFPEEAREIDADLAALPDYRRIFQKLQRDELPRFEDKFRKMMREGTIRNVVVLQNKLKTNQQEILSKIELINGHLRDIDYNEGTYITITHESVASDDIKKFRSQLRAILSGTLGGGKDIYNEQKFLQVKELLDRFAGDTEADRRWTDRVTDVRQWYEFGADERGRDDDLSREFYSDSSGKSGGQKEKLAYTILASAIAFQFGLQIGKSTDRSFRFVVIDEAFGRGSDESTRYGLRLFERLNLQLLIVTPLQKINVIEDYVASVHFVDNPDGKNSRVRNIGITEYRAEREAFRREQLANQ